MRKLIMAVATASMLGLGATSGTVAAPVPGFEGLYSTLIASCSLPDGTEAACEAAITAYADALVAAVDIEVANQSFSEARQEVFALNAGDTAFQAAIAQKLRARDVPILRRVVGRIARPAVDDIRSTQRLFGR